MRRFFLIFLIIVFGLINSIVICADEVPGMSAIIYCQYADSTGIMKTDSVKIGSSIVCEAPVTVYCEAVPLNAEGATVSCEWRLYNVKDGNEHPIIDRFEDKIDYTITDFGSYGVKLFYQIITPSGYIYTGETDSAIVTIKESELACPNAFSPNGDGQNDVFRMTKLQSIVELEGEIYNRWGQVLHTFTLENINEGWDGKQNGKYVKDGGYLLRIHAKGSEGKEYNIRKVINVLKGYRNEESEGQGNSQ